MGMRNLFKKAAMTAIKVAGDITEIGTYLEASDDGFGNVSKLERSCQIIYDDFTDSDAGNYSFGGMIQIKDVKGIVPTLSITVPIIAHNKIRTAAGIIYTIEAFDLDAAGAAYILLLRKV